MRKVWMVVVLGVAILECGVIAALAIGMDGRIAAIDKAVQPETSAEDMAVKLGALNVPARH